MRDGEESVSERQVAHAIDYLDPERDPVVDSYIASEISYLDSYLDSAPDELPKGWRRKLDFHGTIFIGLFAAIGFLFISLFIVLFLFWQP